MVVQRVRRIAMVGFPEAQMLDICGPLEVFSRASRVLSDEGRKGPDVYTVELLARHAGLVRTSSGIELVASRSFESVRNGLDTLLVAGGRGVHAALSDRALINWLRRIAPRVRRLASVCTGTFLLAEAGLLDGKRVTTHWASCDKLAAQYPRLTVDPDPIFIRQGRLYTAAGVTSGMDLALALVAEDHGTAVSRAVARELVLFLQRPGGQSQFSTQLQIQSSDSESLAELQAWMADHLGEDLSVDALARRVAMSPRNFARVFAKRVGTTPARFVQRMRVEAARRRLEESEEGVKEIAAECGFGTAESMRRAFLRAIRVPPSAYRSRFSETFSGELVALSGGSS
jgi:transcriptional regulator GlxA family with amidase domain